MITMLKLRTLLYGVVLTSLLMSTSCKLKKQDPNAPQEPEETSVLLIKHLIDLESISFYNRNYSRWANCYKQDSKTCWVCVEKQGILEARGWDELSSLVKNYMEENPKRENVHISRDNFSISVKGTVAWVTFDEHQTSETGQIQELHGVRILELVDKEWKISYMNSYPKPQQQVSSNQ